MRGLIIAAAVMGAPTGALAHICEKPAAPVIPGLIGASAGERNEMAMRIDAYIAEMNVFLACLERSDAEARAEVQRVRDAFEATTEDIVVIE